MHDRSPTPQGPATRLANHARRGPFARLLDLFSSIRFGVVLLSILFVYSSIGSAGILWYRPGVGWVHDQIRQWRGLEMTEFEWFHWWPFDLLIALICITVVTATLRRIPFKPINFGVLMIHSGILLLAFGSVLYFGTKVEGDAPVVRRRLAFECAGERATMPAVPGNRIVIGEGDGARLVEVAAIEPAWTLPGEAGDAAAPEREGEMSAAYGAGATAFAAFLAVQDSSGLHHRRVVAGHPDLDADVVPTGDASSPFADVFAISASRPATAGMETVSFPAIPGARAQLGAGEGAYTLEVRGIDPSWELLSGDHSGERAFSVTVAIEGGGKSFMRQLIAGFPEFTEDLVRTGDMHQPFARAKKVNADGRPLIDDTLSLALDEAPSAGGASGDLHVSMEYEPQTHFYLANNIVKSWAIYLREAGTTEWIERPIDGLPLYQDYIVSPNDVWPGLDVPEPDPLDVTVRAVSADDPFEQELRITRYLRYATIETRLIPGGAKIDPNLVVRLGNDEGLFRDYELQALDPARNHEEGGRLAFAWARSDAHFRQLTESREPTLTVSIPGTAIEIVHPIRAVTTIDSELPFTEIEETDYAFRVRSFQDDLELAGRGVFSVAIVEVRRGDERYLRWVFDDPALVRDLDLLEGGAGHGDEREIDGGIAMRYEPRGGIAAPVLVVAGPEHDALGVRLAIAGREPQFLPLEIGEPVKIDERISMIVRSYTSHGERRTLPRIVPRAERDRDANESLAMVRVELPSELGGASTWVPFHHYPVRDANESLRRFSYRPATADLPDGRRIEMILSRRRAPLPAPVVLDDFHVTAHVGGYTGRASSIRNWTSVVRFGADGGDGWGAETPVAVNEPCEHDGFWFFQAFWDAPTEPRFEGDAASKGLNYTVLGVGNRRGVNVQLAGCALAVIGMIFAFYVKPIIRRRQRDRALTRSETVRTGAGALSPALAMRRVMPILLALAIGSAAAAQGDESAAPGAPAPTPLDEPVLSDADFASRLDLAPLGPIAVHTEGRLKSFDSFASSMMRAISGPHRIDGQTPIHTYLDLMLRPEAYVDRDIVYVKKKQMRAQIATALAPPSIDVGADFRARLDRFVESGLISEELLLEPDVHGLLQRLQADLIRTAKFVDMIESALTVKDARTLVSSWRIVPPPGGASDRPWLSLEEVVFPPDHGGAADVAPETRESVSGVWRSFVNGWIERDPEATSAAAAQLALLLPTLEPAVYPDSNRLAWESFYFRAYNLTWFWVFYAIALVPLLLDTVFRWKAARWIGLGAFLIAFGLHTAALLLRWYVSQRWPNTNMFEAVTTSAWFGGCAALVLEIVARRTPMRNLFALGSAVASMVALMCAYYFPLQLDAGIGNKMPVLHDVWLYIHTNVIIFSYCLIAMSAVSALLYLLWRGLLRVRGDDSGPLSYARAGGAASIIAGSPGAGALQAGGLGAVLDGTTMVVMELGFIMLWAGLVMGAIWADHSWGRPWGWDPKEVFALNTFIALAILVHVRLRSRDKGFWTAVIAIFGAGVMLFNWIAINFVITGLHSYA